MSSDRYIGPPSWSAGPVEERKERLDRTSYRLNDRTSDVILPHTRSAHSVAPLLPMAPSWTSPRHESVHSGSRASYQPASLPRSTTDPSIWASSSSSSTHVTSSGLPMHAERHSPGSIDASSSNEMGEPRKRKRIQQACKACSVRRVKCDGQKPCETCVRNGEECTYGVAKKRGPPKGTMRGGRKGSGVYRGDESYPSRFDSDYRGEPARDDRVEQEQGRGSTTTRPYDATYGSGTNSRGLEASKSFNGVEQLPPYYRPTSPQAMAAETQSRLSLAPRYGGPSSFASSSAIDPTRTSHPPPSPSTIERWQMADRHPTKRDPFRLPTTATMFPSRRPEPAGQDQRVSVPYAHHPPLPMSALPTLRGPSREARDLPHPPSASPPARLDEARWPPSASIISIAPLPAAATDDLDADSLADQVLLQLHQERQRRRRDRRIEGDDNSREDRLNRPRSTSLLAADTRSAPTAGVDLPQISDETVDSQFRTFWYGITLHWPLYPRALFPTMASFRDMCQREQPLLLNAICSLTALVSERRTDSQDDPVKAIIGSSKRPSQSQISDIFAVRAHYLQIDAIANPSVESAAALMFLSLRETGAGRPRQAAHYCWAACRMALDLNMHRRVEEGVTIKGLSLNPAEQEMRRRVVWAIYTVDKVLACQLGSSPALRDQEMDCAMPTFEGEEDVWTWNTAQQRFFSNDMGQGEATTTLDANALNMTTYFTHGCRLAQISERIIQQYNVVRGKRAVGAGSAEDKGAEGMDRLVICHRQLEQWDRDTPNTLRWCVNRDEPYYPYILHHQMWWQALRILLHRSHIGKAADLSSGIDSHAQCSDAANVIWKMFGEFEKRHPLRQAPSSTVYCVFLAAIISMANTTSVDEALAESAKRQLIDVVQWFRHLSDTRTSALRYLAILGKLPGILNADLVGTDLPSDMLYQTLRVGTKRADTPAAAVERIWESIALIENHRPTLPKGKGGSTCRHISNTVASSTWTGVVRSAPAINLPSEPSMAAKQRHTQASEDFWSDMPLGDNLGRWLTFIETHAGILGQSKTMMA